MNGIQRIAAERQRQIEVEGWTSQHDDAHNGGQLAQAAAAYALNCRDLSDELQPRYPPADLWPWPDGWKPDADPIRDLEKAGALIAAEIDRLIRAAATAACPLSLEEFTRRFTAEAKRLAGFDTFDDGVKVDDYCKEVAASYYADPLYREEGPEACAKGDVSYWGEE
jgi:hypothetical protein